MDASTHLAANLKALREERGLTQAALARKARIPKATWSGLESGSANPTLAVLLKAATALEVPIEELLQAPRGDLWVQRAREVSRRKTGPVEVRELGTGLQRVHLERMELAPGAAMAGVPHARGSREVLCCERGVLSLVTMGRRVDLAPGDVVQFPGDRKHGYRNVGDGRAVAYSAVVG